MFICFMLRTVNAFAHVVTVSPHTGDTNSALQVMRDLSPTHEAQIQGHAVDG